ncbi:ribosome maturation factor RimP [Actinotalea sp. K2]|uniref:ribosome maturation factor RimP n=1 Tax=Actinotalea sp. K2 TaxID=2939438 RepID=UPI002017F8B6|nr:ribosome maturation factor RimP [Actinotalea sp. K2]MCL3860205.1 ribosome maturation factor RimP [Actinotalea sp. K2]
MVTSGSGQVQRVREAIEPVVAAAGLFLEDVAVVPAGRRSAVRVVVDLDEDAVGSLDLDALSAVSREVSAALDAADPVRGEYVLEVSSPGTSRPLTELRHFRRARTRRVALTLTDGSVVTGRLIAAGPTRYELEDEGTTRTLDPALVVRGTVEVELTRAGPTDPQDDEEQD